MEKGKTTQVYGIKGGIAPVAMLDTLHRGQGDKQMEIWLCKGISDGFDYIVVDTNGDPFVLGDSNDENQNRAAWETVEFWDNKTVNDHLDATGHDVLVSWLNCQRREAEETWSKQFKEYAEKQTGQDWSADTESVCPWSAPWRWKEDWDGCAPDAWFEQNREELMELARREAEHGIEAASPQAPGAAAVDAAMGKLFPKESKDAKATAATQGKAKQSPGLTR